MGVVQRGVKNAFRNGVRSLSVIFILAISVSMALVMLTALKAVSEKINNIKSSVGNIITVTLAGMRGFEGGGTLLNNEDADAIKSMDHVRNVLAILNARLTTIGTESPGFGRNENSNLNAQTSLSAPPIQQKSETSGSTSNRHFVINGQEVTGRNFSMPITVVGLNNLSNLSALNASSYSVSSGVEFDPATNENIAMLGKDLASQNNIFADGTFTAYGQTITVSGIFDAGNVFANASIVMPIKTLQNLSGEAEQINSLIVTADSIDSLPAVQNAIKDKLGENVDVTNSEQSSQNAISPLENIKTISFYSLIGSLVAGAIIIFLTMVMIVRERRREIGVLKAIGSSNIGIMTMFTVESLVLTITSSILGIVAGVLFSNPVLKILISSSESAPTNNFSAEKLGQGMGRFGQGAGQMMARFGGGIENARNSLQNLHAIIGWDIILYGLGAAVIIAIAGSAVSSFVIVKIRPAEVMRQE